MSKLNRNISLVAMLVVTFLFFLAYMWNRPQVTIFNVKKYGIDCQLAGSCRDIVRINCGAEVDGPLFYVNKHTGEIIEYCGGYCMRRDKQYCRNCPPKQWVCKSDIRTQTGTETDETANWKTYTNTKYGYAVSYPPIPDTHIAETEGTLTLYLSAQAPQLTLVIKAEKSTNPSLERLIERTINRNCCNITKEKLDFKDVPAMRGIHVIIGLEAMSAYFEYLAFVKDQNEYIITVDSGVEELSEQHRTLIDQILSTFKFLD